MRGPRLFRTWGGWHLYWGPLELDVYRPQRGRRCLASVVWGPLSAELGRWYLHGAVDL